MSTITLTTGNVKSAVDQPKLYLSIQMDGTDQLPFGIPSFPDICKDEGKHRIMFHELVVYVHHGATRKVIVYDSMEHIAHGPSMTIDGLQRTLKTLERENNGFLPDTLFLQLDNCYRENKNAYLFAFLANLVERKVFKHIYVSYLPVGHTHDLVDQVNSRLSKACDRQIIPTRDRLFELIETGYDPTPSVVRMDGVANFRKLVNPELSSQYGGSRCLIHQMSGVVNPLYFLIELDPNGRPGIRTKLTCEQTLWSTYFHPLRKHPSGIDVSQIEGNDFKVVDAKRIEEIERDIESVSWRLCMTPEVLNSVADEVKIIQNPPNIFNWADAGKFNKEDDAGHAAAIEAIEEKEEIARVEVRPHPGIFASAYRRQTHIQQIIEVDRFVAVDMRGNHRSEDDVLRFYVGKVRNISPAIKQVNVRWWNAVSEFDSKYKCYSGAGQNADVKFGDILMSFTKFTTTGHLMKKDQKAIKALLAMDPEDRLSVAVDSSRDCMGDVGRR